MYLRMLRDCVYIRNLGIVRYERTIDNFAHLSSFCHKINMMRCTEIRFPSQTVASKLIFRPIRMKHSLRYCLEIVILTRAVATLAFDSRYKTTLFTIKIASWLESLML